MGGVVFSIVLTIHVLAGLGVIGLVLMQHGKGRSGSAESEARKSRHCETPAGTRTPAAQTLAFPACLHS